MATLITMCCWCQPGVDFMGRKNYLLDLDTFSFLRLGSFQLLILQINVVTPFPLFSFWGPYNTNVITFNGLMSSQVYFSFCIIFSFICSDQLFSTTLSSSSLICSSSSSLQFIPSSVFLISFTVFFTSNWFIYVLRVSLRSSTPFSDLVSIFMIIILNYLSVKLHMFVSLMSRGFVLFFHLHILSNSLHTVLCIMKVSSVSCSWK